MAEQSKTWTKKCKILKWTKTCFSSCYFPCNSFQARLTEMNFRPASAFTLFCVEVQMFRHHQSYGSLNSWLLLLCKCLCRHWMWCTCGHIQCWSARLSMLMPLSSGIPDVLQEFHGLLRTWSVRLRRRPMWKAFFLYVSCSILGDKELCSGFSR